MWFESALGSNIAKSPKIQVPRCAIGCTLNSAIHLWNNDMNSVNFHLFKEVNVEFVGIASIKENCFEEIKLHFHKIIVFDN